MKGQILFNAIPEKPEKKKKAAIAEVQKLLKKFIKAEPSGLYRGEALILLGEIALEKEWNVKDSEKYYSEALNWFKNARKKKDALSLYAPLSDELKKQSKATQKPTSLNKWKRTVYHPEDPLKLYNTASAPTWYISDKEKNCVFLLGFFKFLSGKYDQALEYFKEVKKLDQSIAMLENMNTPNILMRLRAACKTEKMLFSAKERNKFKGKNKIKLAFGELEFGISHFEKAKDIFTDIYSDKSSSKYERIAALLGMGYCNDLLMLGEKRKERLVLTKSTWQKAYSMSKGTPFEAHALWMMASYLSASTETKKEAIPYLKEYLKKYPDGAEKNAAQFSLIVCYLQIGNSQQMIRYYRDLRKKGKDIPQVKELERIFAFYKINPRTGKVKKANQTKINHKRKR